LRLNPSNDICANNISITYDCLNRTNKAMKYIKKAIDLNPNKAVYLLNKGVLLNKLNKHTEAIVFLDLSIEIDNDLIAAYFSKDLALIALNRFKEAAEWSLKSFQKFPNKLNFYKSAYQSILCSYENTTRNHGANNQDWIDRMKILNSNLNFN
jgi:tetratricopeptide (TPR) repeat protein